ncbi:MAG: alpha/beta hydrolase [Chthoniobacterales bacterium]
MRPLKHHTTPHRVRGVLCSIVLLLSSALCPAQTSCPSDDEPEGMQPPQERLADEFQPHIYDPADNTVLRRLRYRPSTPGTSWPTVLSLPPAVFRNGDALGVPTQRIATKDLIAAGFLVFQVEHRLAPNGLLLHQTKHTNSPAGIASGRPPQQTDDIKQQVLAALADPECNGNLYLIGGSSGGSHALWVALDSASGNVTAWNDVVRGKIKAVVSLSGVTDLGSREHDPNDDITMFAQAADNYTNVAENDPQRETKQYSKSPVSLVANATNIPPIRLYATEDDSVPHQQSEEMYLALFPKGVDVARYVLGGSEHAYNYWHMINNITGQCVSSEVTAFFDANR